MIFANSFTVAASPEEAWKIILDVPEIAPCLPGANLTEQVDANTYKGNVAIKLGPVALVFNGTAEITERKEVEHSLVVLAKGSDSKGRGAAKAVARFKLLPDPRGTKVHVDTDLSLTGSVAQYGRGAGLIQGVAAAMIEQFEHRLNARLGQGSAAQVVAATGVLETAAVNSIGPGLLWRVVVNSIRNVFR
jgi:carbon monoxide dehydrogenase subunit G